MKRQNKNIMTGLLLIAGLFIPLGLQAQTFLGTPWTQTSPAVTTGTDTNGTFLSTAPLNLSLTFNTTETGTTNPQFLWVPGLSALRAGTFASAPSATTMGEYSVAFGHNSTASSPNSVAMGGGSATGPNSVALGGGTEAVGPSSTAVGEAYAFGNYSFAAGQFSDASGYASMAVGLESAATGNYSVALGGSLASGDYSMSVGKGTSAGAYESFAVGTYNVNKTASGGTVTAISPGALTDPVFEVGNGSYNTMTLVTTYSDALVVYRNGNAVFSPPPGTASCSVTAPVFITTGPGGDIPMYMGN